MKTEKINLQTTNFKPKLIPNKALEDAFNEAYKTNDRRFALSVKTILNDGKNDVLELSQRNKYNINLYVNGECKEEGYNYLNYYTNVGSNLINNYVQKEYKNTPQIIGKYYNLSESEKILVRENVDIIKLLVDNFENGINFIDNVQKEIGNIKNKINENVKQELTDLKEIIFKK